MKRTGKSTAEKRSELKKRLKRKLTAQEWWGILIAAALLLVGTCALLHGLRFHYLNTFIFGFVCLLIGLHHYLKIMFRRVFGKID